LTLALPLRGLFVISFLEANPCAGWSTRGFMKTRYLYPHPWTRVRVLTGTGAGYSGKPQGSL